RERTAVEQAHGADGPAAGDRHTGHDRVVPGRVLDRRDHAQVDAAGVEIEGYARRDVADDLESGLGVEAADERDRVEVGHDPQAQGPGTHHSLTTLNTVSRSTGRRPASRTRRTSSWTVMACAVGAPASCAIFSSVTVPSMSSAPKDRPTW